MKKIGKEKIIKILDIILIILWMITIFMFSNQQGDKSSNTSKKVTTAVVQAISDKSVEENENIIEQLDKVVRKLAHYSIYTLGGILIINYAYTTDKNIKQKIVYSIAFGAFYAITDELHQFFVSNRSARIFDVGIDTLGVMTGILIYILIRKLFEKIRVHFRQNT